MIVDLGTIKLLCVGDDFSPLNFEVVHDLQKEIRKVCGRFCSFRGVSIDRLGGVLKTGVDVEPTDAVFWVNELQKALEYGGWPKVLMAFDSERLKRSWIEIDENAPAGEIGRIRRDYPTVIPDGEKLYCSRLPSDAPQLMTAYEFQHAFWIPGEALEALKALFIVFRPQDQDQVREALLGLGTG
jgi:hypothetical protein